MVIQYWPLILLRIFRGVFLKVVWKTLLNCVMIPSSRPEGGDHSLWADEEKVQSV